MGEIKTEIVEREDGTFLIEEVHTLADIVRMLLSMSDDLELQYLIEEVIKEESAYRREISDTKQVVYETVLRHLFFKSQSGGLY